MVSCIVPPKSEKLDNYKIFNLSQDLYAAALPGDNCQKMEDDLPPSTKNIEPDYKVRNTVNIKPNLRRKLTVKNEKKVEKGELDEIFERMRMKKMKSKKEKQEIIIEAKNETVSKLTGDFMKNSDENIKKKELMKAKGTNNEKRMLIDEKKKKKHGEIDEKQKKLTNWVKMKKKNDENQKGMINDEKADAKIRKNRKL